MMNGTGDREKVEADQAGRSELFDDCLGRFGAAASHDILRAATYTAVRIVIDAKMIAIVPRCR